MTTLDLDPRYGVGTTEYMRSVGGWALTVECGQHDDPAAAEMAYRAIVRTLAHLRLIESPDPPPVQGMELLRLVDVVDKTDADDRFDRLWEELRPGTDQRADRHARRWHSGPCAARRLYRLS